MQQLTSIWATLRAARWIWVPFLAFLVTRLGIVLVACVTAPVIVDPITPSLVYARPDNLVLDIFASRWDSSFYVAIAQDGYKYTNVPLPYVAFFPLLPLLMRGATWVIADVLVAGLFITNMALLLAAMLLHRLVDMEWGSGIADRSVWYLLIFPTSFYGSAVYGDSLYLLGVIAAALFARSDRWIAAAISGMVAALARPMGVLVVLMLVLEWWQQRRTNAGLRLSWPVVIAFLAPIAGLAAYMLYLQVSFGDALAFVHAQEFWGRDQSLLSLFDQLLERPEGGWSVGLLTGNLPRDEWIDAGIVLLFATLGFALLREQRWSEGVFILANLLVTLNGGAWMSQRRHVWILFPAFVLLARWSERPWVDRILTLFFLLGLGVFTTMFANWYWVA